MRRGADRKPRPGPPFPSPWSDTAFAAISPWAKLLPWNALLAFVGVDMNSCTMKHWIESRLVQDDLRLLPPDRRQAWRSVLAHDCLPGPWAYYDSRDMAAPLDAMGLIRHATLGAAHVMSIRTQDPVPHPGNSCRKIPSAGLPQIT